MGIADRYGGRIVLTALTMALSAAACLPIKHSYLVSPRILGTFQVVDGHAASGSFELATGRMGDSTCTMTTLQSPIDSAGRFSFASQEIHSNWTPLIPYDAVASVYSLCYRSGGVAREVYRGIAVRGTASDSITCLATPRSDTLAVQCRGQRAWHHVR